MSSCRCCFFFFNDTATTEIYTLSLHDALPISLRYKESPTINRGATPDTSYASAENGVQLQNALDEIMRILSRLDEQRITEQKALIEKERNRIADRKSTRLNSSHSQISYAVFCL